MKTEFKFHPSIETIIKFYDNMCGLDKVQQREIKKIKNIIKKSKP